MTGNLRRLGELGSAEETGFLLWETAGSRIVRRIPGHDGTSYGIAFNRSGSQFVSGSEDRFAVF